MGYKMATIEKLFKSVMCGMQDKNIKFKDLQKLLNVLGFEYRIRGDHFIYYYKGLPENLNIQPVKNMAKPYQIKQVRDYLLKYHLGL